MKGSFHVKFFEFIVGSFIALWGSANLAKMYGSLKFLLIHHYMQLEISKPYSSYSFHRLLRSYMRTLVEQRLLLSWQWAKF